MPVLPEARFWSKVAMTGNICECWEWTASKQNAGYGQFNIGGRKTVLAHRVAYEHTMGPIPPGLHIDHLCGNKSCVNPWHLEPVTQAENNRRSSAGFVNGLRKRSQKLCKRYHELSGDNLYTWNGHRICRSCASMRKRSK